MNRSTVPARRLELVRMATFGYAAAWLVIRAGYVWDLASLPARRFEPVGLLSWLDSSPSRSVVMVTWGLALAGSVLAVLGKGLRVSAPLGALAMLLLATYASSFGQVFHTEHLLVLHLLILAAAALTTRRRGGEVSAWPLDLMAAVVVLTYVLAGLAKLRYSGLDWLTGDALRNWVAVDNLRKILVGDVHSSLGGWLTGIGWIWMPLAVVTLLVELGAPVALLPGRIRYLWLALAWTFHLGVLALMAILFPYQLSGVAFLAFLPVERAVARARRWRRQRRVDVDRPSPTPVIGAQSPL